MLGLNIGILAVVLTTLLTLFLDTPFILEYMRPDHMITSVELPSTEEPQKASAIQEPMFLPSGLTVETGQVQTPEIFEQESRNLYENNENYDEMKYDEATEDVIEILTEEPIVVVEEDVEEVNVVDTVTPKEDDEEVIVVDTVVPKENENEEVIVGDAVVPKEDENEEVIVVDTVVPKEDDEEVIVIETQSDDIVTPKEDDKEIIVEETQTDDNVAKDTIAPEISVEDPDDDLKEETEECNLVEEQKPLKTLMSLITRDYSPQELFFVAGVLFVAYSLVKKLIKAILKYFAKSPWEKCPYYVEASKSYTVSAENLNAVAKTEDGPLTTVISATPLPLNAPSSWNIKILKSKENDCYAVYVGVAPYDIDLNNEDNLMSCGWYYNCFSSSLWSGPPHNYGWPKERYGPEKEDGGYHREGSVIGVTMDPVKRELSFTLDGTSYGAAYTGIPAEKPLVPCVILGNKGDSVEFVLDAKNGGENARRGPIKAPTDLSVEDFSWDSVAISWSPVPDVKFYQVDVDRARNREISKTNSFRARSGLLPGTDHTFRVRAVCSYGFSDWSETLYARTEDAPDFSLSTWKAMPPVLSRDRRYELDGVDACVATKTGRSSWTSVVGSAPLPPSSVVQWSINAKSIKYRSSRSSPGGLYVGVVQSDADTTIEIPYQEGWYFYCYDSTLCSGPPHNYSHKKYGPRKENGQYVKAGDSVGVIMDTEKGNMSFVMNEVNHGVAYEGIPLDKPLVPCALLYSKGDSVGLVTVEIKEDICYDQPQPPYVVDVRWNSIVVGWEAFANMYQCEVNNDVLQIEGGGTMIIENLKPSTVYNIRLRYILYNAVSEWSTYTTTKTSPMPFSGCSWKECAEGVDVWKRYVLSPQSPRIATCTNHNDWHTVVSSITVPQDMVTTWRVRIVTTRDNDGKSIYTGVAPYDIDQNEDSNITVSGWYFHCFNSTLWSGPPHKIKWRLYGPRMGEGNYVHAGDSVDVTMDTNRGELSFAVKETKYGVAFDGIPLDKPLVASTVMYYGGDSVELSFLNGRLV